MSNSDLQAWPACRRKRGPIGVRLVIDGFGARLHSLRRGLVVYGVACWAPGSWIGSSRTR